MTPSSDPFAHACGKVEDEDSFCQNSEVAIRFADLKRSFGKENAGRNNRKYTHQQEIKREDEYGPIPGRCPFPSMGCQYTSKISIAIVIHAGLTLPSHDLFFCYQPPSATSRGMVYVHSIKVSLPDRYRCDSNEQPRGI
jgi:hypothetical protein